MQQDNKEEFDLQADLVTNMKRRVLVEPAFNSRRGKYNLLEGVASINTVIYTGSLLNCLKIKEAYLGTGQYLDETENPDWK